MAKTKYKQKYGAGGAAKKGEQKKQTRSAANAPKAPKASSNSRKAPPKKQKSSTGAWLRNTLLPKAKMEVQLNHLMETLHEREKLSDEDFNAVKSTIVRQSYGLFFLSAVWTGLSFYLVFEQKFDPTSATVQAGVGCVALIANLMGILGAKFESDNLLISYLSLMTCLVLVTLLVGTYGIVITPQNVRAYELARERGSSLALSSTVTPDQLKLLSYVIGALSIIQVPLQGYSVKNAGKMLTTMRAVTNFMETLTILMFPIGCIFIAGGVFIIQNLQDPTSAITALFIFAIGCGIIMLAVLGYFGTVIHSRGMLLMFQWPVLISIIFLFAFGVWASVQADVVKQTLETQWEDIRKFLPTTFEGRYDKVLFGEFLENNLQMIAFGCFYTGIFFLFCSFGAGLMRQEIKTEHHILKAAEKQLTLVLGQEEAHREELQSVARLEQQGLSHSQAVQQTHQKYQKNKVGHLKKFEKAHAGEIHKRWKSAWTNGDKFTRCMTKVGCASVCLVLIIVVACGLAFLVYASFCEGLTNTCATQNFSPTNMMPDVIQINNQYKRGTMTLASGANKDAFADIPSIITKTNGNTGVAFTMKSCSLDNGYQQGQVIQDESITGVVKYDINTVADPQMFFGVDKSCQQSLTGIAVPATLLPRLNITTQSMVRVVGSKQLQFRELIIVGKNAEAVMNKVIINYLPREDDEKHHALYSNSDLGDIKIHGKCSIFPCPAGSETCGSKAALLYIYGKSSNAECDNVISCESGTTLFPRPSAAFESVNGFMTIKDTQLNNCDLTFISKDSAPTVIENVVVKCSSKHCQLNNNIDVTAQRGSVQLSNVIADSIAIRTNQGRVTLNAITQLNPETGVTITTGRGNIQLRSLVASGNIQLESKEGSIELKIPMCGIYPAYMGSFQILHASFQKSYREIFEPINRVTTRDVWSKLTPLEKTKKSIMLDRASSLDGTITGSIGCHMPSTGSICPYSNELLITTESGKITIVIDECSDVCPGAGGIKPACCTANNGKSTCAK